MKLLFSLVLPVTLSGCWSQIFLDSVPGKDATNIADSVVIKEVYAMSSDACERPPVATRYQIREHLGHGWIQRCARVNGFEFRPGNDYLLEVKEYPSDAPGPQLVLAKVIAEWPQADNR